MMTADPGIPTILASAPGLTGLGLAVIVTAGLVWWVMRLGQEITKRTADVHSPEWTATVTAEAAGESLPPEALASDWQDVIGRVVRSMFEPWLGAALLMSLVPFVLGLAGTTWDHVAAGPDAEVSWIPVATGTLGAIVVAMLVMVKQPQVVILAERTQHAMEKWAVEKANAGKKTLDDINRLKSDLAERDRLLSEVTAERDRLRGGQGQVTENRKTRGIDPVNGEGPTIPMPVEQEPPKGAGLPLDEAPNEAPRPPVKKAPPEEEPAPPKPAVYSSGIDEPY